jgi:hypothetical protein
MASTGGESNGRIGGVCADRRVGEASGDAATMAEMAVAGGRGGAVGRDGRGVFLPFPDEKTLAIHADGHYRGSPRVEKELVYVVQTDKGQETLTPEEFAQRYHWKNDPTRVRLTGK